MIELIPFDKILENSDGIVLLLAKQSIAILTNRTRHFMFSGDFANSIR